MGELAQNKINQIAPIDPEGLIMKALENNVPVETMERLLSMRKELKAEQARTDYFSALTKFQAKCPVINKGRTVKDRNGKDRYAYASLDDIVKEISPLLEEFGLSFSIKTEYKDGFIIAMCETHHISGHSEVSTFPVPIEKEAYMNEAQKVGSAQTYAKRYAFCNAFGILTGDTDDDGKSLGDGVSVQDLYRKYTALTAAIFEHYDSIMAIKSAVADKNLDLLAEAYSELDRDTIMTLWVAPTKGGPFTTEERKIMKSDEFSEALRAYKTE